MGDLERFAFFLPKISLKFAKWEKKISYKKCKSAKDFAKIPDFSPVLAE